MAASRSRWLVGSSSSRMSGSRNSTPASATRIRQPPENDDSGSPWAVSSKPSPLRIRAARAGAAAAPISISRLWSSAIRIGSWAVAASCEQAGPHGVRRQHRLERGHGAARRLLPDHADLRVGRDAERAGIGLQLAHQQPQQGGLAGAVAADQAHPGIVGDAQRRPFEQGTASDSEGEVFEFQHVGRVDSMAGSAAQPRACRRPPADTAMRSATSVVTMWSTRPKVAHIRR